MVAVAEYMQRSVDRELIEQASTERRILLTEDKDFGWLVYVSHAESDGVILIRYPGNARSALAQTVLHLVQTQDEKLVGAFVVVGHGQIRITPRPVSS